MPQCWIATGWCGHIIGATSCAQEESVVAKDCADWEKRGLTLTLVNELDTSKWCPPDCPTRNPEAAAKHVARLTGERDAAIAREKALDAEKETLGKHVIDALQGNLSPWTQQSNSDVAVAVKRVVERLGAVIGDRNALRAQLDAHKRALDVAVAWIEKFGPYDKYIEAAKRIRALAEGK